MKSQVEIEQDLLKMDILKHEMNIKDLMETKRRTELELRIIFPFLY